MENKLSGRMSLINDSVWCREVRFSFHFNYSVSGNDLIQWNVAPKVSSEILVEKQFRSLHVKMFLTVEESGISVTLRLETSEKKSRFKKNIMQDLQHVSTYHSCPFRN